jgi:hypothetical protein
MVGFNEKFLEKIFEKSAIIIISRQIMRIKEYNSLLYYLINSFYRGTLFDTKLGVFF